MIKRITLENFFSFRSTTIELDSCANVLVGINGSGKSNLLKALKLLQRVASGGIQDLIMNQWGGVDAVRHKGSNASADIRIEVVFSMNFFANPRDIHYELILHRANEFNYYISERMFTPTVSNDYTYLEFSSGNGVILRADGTSDKYTGLEPKESVLSKIFDLNVILYITEMKIAMASIAVYDYFDTRPDATVRKPIFSTGKLQLSPHGSNLAQVLNTIKINDKAHFKQIVDNLNKVNENYTGIDFNQIGGNIELMLEETGFNTSVHVSKISDGTLKFLCLLSIFYNQHSGRLVCIDEPENGLHPDMIHAIIRGIRDAQDMSQYLIATHSDILLDGFSVEEVRVLEKDPKNATVVNCFSEEDFKGWYDNFALGQMWRKGDIGGNRW